MSHDVSETAQRVLRELGLTTYEAAVYLSLVQQGVLTASEVSESAGVPFSKVYEVLNNLEQKGWVNVERGRPSRYFAKAPGEAFAAARTQLEGKIRRWERAIVDELQPLYEHREVREKPDIWILRGETSVLAKIQEMLRTARSQVMIALPSFAATLAGKAMPLLTTLRILDAQVQVMVAGDVKRWGLQSVVGNVEVRHRDALFGGGVIVDGAQALLLLGEDQRPTLFVWSNHVGLVKFAADYFQHLWNSSQKLD